jgi:hypothetical protein
MDKISRILPPSRRVTASDIESNQPVRPGAPEFGRPSRSSLDVQDRVSLSSLANGHTAEPAAAVYKNTSKDSTRAKVVDELAEKFFNPRTFAKDRDSTLTEDTLKSLQDNEGFRQIAAND